MTEEAEIQPSLPATATLADAAVLVGRRLCPRILLLDEDGKAIGQIDEETIRLALCTEGRPHHVLREWMQPLAPEGPAVAKGAPVTEALLMAGGFGTRLSPLTDNCPKPLLPIQGIPLLHRLLTQVARAGIRRAHVSLHYLPEMVRESLADFSQPDLEIDFIEETEPLGTAGALGLLPKLASPILVMNGDVLSEINLEAFFAWHRRHGNEVTMATHLYEVHVPFGLAHFDDQVIRRLEEKPTLRLPVNAGIYVFQPDRIADVPRERPWDMVNWLNLLSKTGKVGHFPIVEEWHDIGSLEAYQRLEGRSTP